MPSAEVSFVYLRRLDDGLPPGDFVRVVREMTGTSRSPRAPRRWLIQIAAFVLDRRLYVEWHFDPGVHRRETVERIAAGTMADLRHLFAEPTPNGDPERVEGGGRESKGRRGAGGAAAPRRSPLLPLRSGGGRPFFCVHPAGGSALCYRGLARHAGDRSFYGIQGRGLMLDEDPGEKVEHMAAEYLEAVLAIQPSGPYLLGGWSFGGTVAFEMALQLQALGQSARLVVIDSRPASNLDLTHLPRDEELVAMFGLGASLFQDGLRRAGAVFEPEPDEVRRAFRVWKCHLSALIDYSPGSRYRGSIAILAATEPTPPDIPRVLAVDGTSLASGWELVSTEAPIVLAVPGNHFTVVAPPNVEFVGRMLDDVLAG
jgi:thioesterase domain-containing protein